MSQHRPPDVPHSAMMHTSVLPDVQDTCARRVIGKPRAYTCVISVLRHAASWSLRAEQKLCIPDYGCRLQV